MRCEGRWEGTELPSCIIASAEREDTNGWRRCQPEVIDDAENPVHCSITTTYQHSKVRTTPKIGQTWTRPTLAQIESPLGAQQGVRLKEFGDTAPEVATGIEIDERYEIGRLVQRLQGGLLDLDN